MTELKPYPLATEAAQRIVTSLRRNEFFTSAWKQIDAGIGKEYFEDLIAEIITDTNRRDQPENKPLTVEELRQMDGDPVWIDDLERPGFSCWRICYWDRGRYLALVAKSANGYLLEDYGKTWLAYRYKPERSAGE